jgi:hypothetical protein
LCFSVCRWRPCDGLTPRSRSPTDCIWSRNWKICQGSTNECRATERQTDRQTDRQRETDGRIDINTKKTHYILNYLITTVILCCQIEKRKMGKTCSKRVWNEKCLGIAIGNIDDAWQFVRRRGKWEANITSSRHI